MVLRQEEDLHLEDQMALAQTADREATQDQAVVLTLAAAKLKQ